MNEFCRRCALIAASLMALGATSPTPEQVDNARISLCQAAAFNHKDSDELVIAAIDQYGENRPEVYKAISRALFEYMEGDWNDCRNPDVTKRLSDVLHAKHAGEPEGS